MDKMKYYEKRILELLLFISLILVSCNNQITKYKYVKPLDINDGLKTGTLEEVKIDSTIIAKGIQKIRSGKFNDIHSILIFKEESLVLEEYFEGHQYQWDAPNYHGKFVQWNREKMHSIMSCSKSFTSACIGIAIDKGFIKNEDEKIIDYLAEYKTYFTGGKENITIEHLLTMTSGLDWDEWSAAHGTSANDIDRIYLDCSDDPIKCILEKELINKPGEKFNYNGGGILILGEILKKATGANIDEFSKKNLFDPLEIDSVRWYQFNNGVYATDGSMYITPREMMKFGVTYLKKGKWNGIEILTEEWVTKSSQIYNKNKGINLPIEDSGRNGYAYSWWISEIDYKGNNLKMYRASGWGGQSIMVFPELDMVVVFTGGNYASKSKLFKLIKNYVLPSINLL